MKNEKPDIFIVGHKNPDTDSVSAAYCYAYLKNQLDSENHYTPIRCGKLTKQTEFVFTKAGVTPPVLKKDAYPRVESVMNKSVITKHENAPLSEIMQQTLDAKIRLTPIVNDEGKYLGMIGNDEITDFSLKGTTEDRPEYLIRPENFEKVIDGKFLQKGEDDEFYARIMVGAMPMHRFVERLKERDNRKFVLVVGNRKKIIEHAIQKNISAIILSGIEENEQIDVDFSGYNGWIYVSSHDSAETMRRVRLCTPSKYILDREYPVIARDTTVEKAKSELFEKGLRGFPIADQAGEILGMFTKSNLMSVQQTRLILVDHNELPQAIDGAEEADIVEVIDHHKLGAIKTSKPIHFYAKPVGSTCTIVYQQYLSLNVEIPKDIAVLLQSAIITDTVILKSPTATKEDEAALEALCKITGLNVQEYGIEIFSASDSILTRDPLEMIQGDMKIFNEYGVQCAIGQVETVSLKAFEQVAEKLLQGLEQVKQEKAVDWALVMVTDIIEETSYLLMTDRPDAEKHLKYKVKANNLYDMPGVLSRKKQLLPEIMRVLEAASA